MQFQFSQLHSPAFRAVVRRGVDHRTSRYRHRDINRSMLSVRRSMRSKEGSVMDKE